MSEALRTVLLVDDDPWSLESMQAALAEEGLRVLATADPVRALPLVEWENVDVLVSDVSMPEVNGVDLIVRARQLFPEVSRVLVTADAGLEGALRAINEGEVFRFLRKPFRAAELRETVRLALARTFEARRAAAAARAEADRTEQLRRLEQAHPGIAAVPEPGKPHAITQQRQKEIAARLRDGGLVDLARRVTGEWLAVD